MNLQNQKTKKGFRFGLGKLFLAVSVLCVAVAFLRTPVLQAWNNGARGDWKRASPFTYVEVDGDQVTVEFQDKKYELVSLNGVETADLLQQTRQQFGGRGDKRFVEDLPQVLAVLGMPESDSVDLLLRDANGEMQVDDAPMTAANRALLYRSSKYPSPIPKWMWFAMVFAVLLFASDAKRFFGRMTGKKPV